MLDMLRSLVSDTTPATSRASVLELGLLGCLIACGALLRFWGLGSVGLHGDEETMGMAVRGILAEGAPILPSGMFYPRGLTQLYLMAGSVSLFGESEWALRLPSALCGVLLIFIAYFVGRRFLRVEWNLAFVAAIAALPELVVYSQTARMYIFFVTCVAAAMAFVFAWERSNRTRWLVAATATLILGMDMQVLAVSAIALFLLPGIVHGDARRLLYGALACIVSVVAFLTIDTWVQAQYPVPPPEFAAELPEGPRSGPAVRGDFPVVFDLLLIAACAAMSIVAWRIGRSIGAREGIAAGVLLLLGAVLQIALFYHLAALSYVAGAVIALRFAKQGTLRLLLVLGGAAALVAAAHAALLAPKAGTLVRLVGAMIGQPSVWPYVRVAQLSLAAGVIGAASLAWVLYRLARGHPVPDYWLLIVLMVWAPVFAIGAFAWNIPPRYTAVALVPLLLSAFAAVQAASDRWLRTRASTCIAAAVTALLVINPVEAARVVNAGYRIHPDHKGTAEYLRSIGVSDDDVVLAEDVLQQTYYLGKVDYWLIGPAVAQRFVTSKDGTVVDFYTGTPVVVSQAMLDRVLSEHADKRIFVIVSGENQADGRIGMRGPELHAAIRSDRFETLYVGRDGKSQVLRAMPSARTPHTGESDTATRDASDAVDASRSESADRAVSIPR